jgi:cbb3-type cytochrome oxidase maturation protein
MEVLVILVPLAIALGAIGLAGFLWSLKSGQYDDLDGAAWRAIADDEPADEEEAKEAQATSEPLRFAKQVVKPSNRNHGH